MLKKPVSKAAASEEARRTLRYVEPLSEARMPLTGFFSILLSAALSEGRQVFHSFTRCCTGFNRRIQTHPWIDLFSELRHPFALLDRFLQMRLSLLAVRIGRGEGFENRFCMLDDFSTVMHDRFRISHSPVRHHILRVLHHGRALRLYIFNRCADHSLDRKQYSK